MRDDDALVIVKAFAVYVLVIDPIRRQKVVVNFAVFITDILRLVILRDDGTINNVFVKERERAKMLCFS